MSVMVTVSARAVCGVAKPSTSVNAATAAPNRFFISFLLPGSRPGGLLNPKIKPRIDDIARCQKTPFFVRLPSLDQQDSKSRHQCGKRGLHALKRKYNNKNNSL
jgi:hypothetical protein